MTVGGASYKRRVTPTHKKGAEKDTLLTQYRNGTGIYKLAYEFN
jgi:hypothetical protein